MAETGGLAGGDSRLPGGTGSLVHVGVHHVRVWREREGGESERGCERERECV